MTRSIHFSVPGRPHPQQARITVRGKRPATYYDDALLDYRARIAHEAGKAYNLGLPAGTIRPPSPNPVSIQVTFAFPRPKSHYNAQRQVRPAFMESYVTKRPDLDRLASALHDALMVGGVLADDAQVIRLEATKIWTPTQGFTEVEIRWPLAV
jgi:Holliday junction resolvase RusA-like endonuclease